MQITLPHPRNPGYLEEFKTVVDNIYRELAVGVARAHGLVAPAPDAPIGIAHRLPNAGIQPMLGLIDAIESHAVELEKPISRMWRKAESLEMDQLLQITKVAAIAGEVKMSTTDTPLLNAAWRIPRRRRSRPQTDLR